MKKDNKLYYDLLDQAFELMNSQLGTAYTRDAIDILLTDAKNGDRDIPKFLKKFSGGYEDYMLEPGYIEQIRSQLVIAKYACGIIARTDVDVDEPYRWRHMIIHDMCRLFLIGHEFEGGKNFYRTYCKGYAKSKIEDGQIYGGYSLWSEVAAEYLAQLVDTEMLTPTLEQNEEHAEWIVRDLKNGAFDVKECLEALLIDCLATQEVMFADSKEEAFEIIAEYGWLDTTYWKKLLNAVYDHLHAPEGKFWEIDIEFIKSIGSYYLGIRAELMMERIGQPIPSGDVDIEKYLRILGEFEDEEE